MITVSLNEANFEYDIHSLVKAFYPEHEVFVRVARREDFLQAALHITVTYTDASVRFSFFFTEGTDINSRAEGHIFTGGDFCGADTDVYGEDSVLRGCVSVNPRNRLETKDRLKRKLYEMLSEFSGRTLPWGTLTGIRPTRLSMSMLERGCPEEEIRAHMRESYYMSEEKIDLSLDVVKRELELLSRIDYEDGYSLYVGIPFCPSTCLYCSFTSYPIQEWRERVDGYLDALQKEMEYTAEACEGKHLNSVYIGGGTPTSLSPRQLDRLIGQIAEFFHLDDGEGHIVLGGRPGGAEQGRIHPKNHLLEFTVEAGRPDSITEEKLDVLKRHRVSRISINPQTMKEETLALIGRCHTAEQTRRSFALARGMGFDNINMDLIAGLPEEGIDDVRRTMEAVGELSPDNVTVHSLALKRAARLAMQRGDYAHLRIENTWETIRLTGESCRAMGLEPYYLYRQKNMAGNFENVGYAAPGKAGIYNILIMEEKQTIMGLGAGSISKLVFDCGERIERAANVKDINHYLRRVDEMIEKKKALLGGYEWL